MGLLSQDKKSYRTQFLFRDDGKNEFLRREVNARFLVERDSKGEVCRGWLHSYTNQFVFAGYGKLQPDMVTISYERDYLLDPYKVVPAGEKSAAVAGAVKIGPKTEDKTVHDPWLVQVGNNSRLQILQNRGQGTNYDKIIMFLGFFLFSEIIVILIEILLKRL